MEMNIPTVREVQQLFAELLGCYGEDINWDLLTENQADILKGKITELFNMRNKVLNKYSNFGSVFDLIWKQRKFTNGQSLTALFFVVFVADVNDSKLAEQSRSWTLYPVFRCRRCVDDNSGRNHSSMDCCMVYVTENGAFENWEMFLSDVYYPSGYMVTPNRGVYKLDNGKVELKTYCLADNRSPSPKGWNLRIKPGPLKQSPCEVHRNRHPFRLTMFPKKLRINPKKCTSVDKYYNLLDECINPTLRDVKVGDLSPSLVIFTHSVNNFRLAKKMIAEKSCHGVLKTELRSQIEKMAGDTSRIKERANLIRSTNEVRTKTELDEIFTSVARNCQEPVDITIEFSKIRVKDEYVNLKDYGQALEEHILSAESFNDLIASMSENLEPEMFKLKLHGKHQRGIN